MGEFEVRYRAVESRDARFDGRIFCGVTSTGIYCRPICPVPMPRPEHCRFYEHAAAAEADGFRPCKRCRPDASPDSPEWDVRSDLVGRALRLIAEGLADEEGVAGLARRLHVAERHLHRLFVAELGVSPRAVARSRRAHLARRLLDRRDLRVADVAFAAGFSSVRAFNETMKQVFRATPTALRNGASARGDGLALQLTARPPFRGTDVLRFLRPRAIPGVEEVTSGAYRRTIRTAAGAAILELRPGPGGVDLRVHADHLPELAPIVQGARRLFDLDADPSTVEAILADDPDLAPVVAARPGLRLPGAWDGFETAVRAILGQQVSVAGATTLAGRLVAAAGERLGAPRDGLSHLFPSPGVLAEADLSAVGLPGARARTIREVAARVAGGELVLDGSADPAETAAALLAVPGIGPWTVAYVGMRGLRDPDAFPASDLGVRRGLDRLGIDPERAERWRPWRGYAAMHLWASLAPEPPPA